MSRNTTIVLVVLFAGLLLYVLLVQRPKDEAAAQATATTNPYAASNLWTAAADQVTGVRIDDRVGGRSLAFSKDTAGTWGLTEPQAQPADQAGAAAAAARFTQLSVVQTITSTTDLAAFGVLSPTYQLGVQLADGTMLSASVGLTNPVGSNYYVLRADEPYVVVVSGTSMNQVLGLLDTPPLPPTPTPAFLLPTPGPGTPLLAATPAAATP